MKECCRCHKKKPLSDFQIDKRRKDGHRSECQMCNVTKQMENFFRKTIKGSQ